MSNTPPKELPILKIPISFYGIDIKDGKLVHDAEARQQLDTYVEWLKQELVKYIGTTADGKPITVPDALMAALKTMPLPLMRLENDYEVPTQCFHILTEHIYMVYEAYKKDKDPGLRGMLMGYPEYVYHFLENSAEPPSKDQLPPSGTEQDAEDNELRVLLQHPYWAMRWLAKHPNQAHFEELKSYLFKLKFVEPVSAHCYHWLKFHNASYEMQKQEIAKILDHLGNSAFISIITARAYPDITVEHFLGSIKSSPMWAYNWMKLVKTDSTGELVENVLLDSVPWAIQYINDIVTDKSEKQVLLNRVKSKPSNPYWKEWLDRYLDKHLDKPA